MFRLGMRKLVLGMICLSLNTEVSAVAATVTLEFEAVIGPPRAGGFNGDLGLPFEFKEGDTITGKYTFQPLDVPSEVQLTETIQPYTIEITIDSVLLSATSYSLDVRNSIVSDDTPLPADEIRLSCSGGTCGPISNNASDPASWTFDLALGGPDSILQGADIPSELSKWSQFLTATFPSNIFSQQAPVRSLLMSFDGPAGNGNSEGLQATISSFRIVPEPTSICLWLTAICSLCCRSRNPL